MLADGRCLVMVYPPDAQSKQGAPSSSSGQQQACCCNLIMNMSAAMLAGSLFNSLNRSCHACRTVHLLCSSTTSSLPLQAHYGNICMCVAQAQQQQQRLPFADHVHYWTSIK